MKLIQDHAMQAIETKYLAPTDRRGARIKATAAAGTLTLGWDWDLNPFENHAKAAVALAEKYGWTEHVELVGGCLPNNNYVFTALRKAGK